LFIVRVSLGNTAPCVIAKRPKNTERKTPRRLVRTIKNTIGRIKKSSGSTPGIKEKERRSKQMNARTKDRIAVGVLTVLIIVLTFLTIVVTSGCASGKLWYSDNDPNGFQLYVEVDTFWKDVRWGNYQSLAHDLKVNVPMYGGVESGVGE
jgi:hypothetical protein